MDVVSLCPFRVAAVPWQPRAGSWALLVVVKATYDLRPVECSLAEVQEYPYEDENHWDDDTARSVYSPSDVVPFKPRADIVLVGHAFTPRREPMKSLTVRLVVAGVDKAVDVVGDRPRGGGDTARFVSMPLRYERAAGGPDTDNPVGVRADSASMPNLQRQGATRQGEVPEPVGFGPVAASWPSRSGLLGPLTATFSPATWPSEALPKIDGAFFNAAPVDQQVERIGPGEHVVLENLNPEHPLLITNLPTMRPRAFALRGAETDEIRLTCDTLWIDTDRSLATLTWRASLSLTRPDEEGRVVLLMERDDTPLTWARIRESLAEHGGTVEEIGTVDSDELLKSHLPFVGSGPLAAGGPPSAARMQTQVNLAASGEAAARGLARHGDLPFLHAPSDRDEGATQVNNMRSGGDGLPFVPVRPPPR